MPLPELDDLQTALTGSDTQPVFRRHLGMVARLLRTVAIRGDARLDDLDAAKQVGDARLDALEAATTVGANRLDAVEATNTTQATQIAAGAGRLSTLEAAPNLTVTVVANVAALPASANVRQWFRVAGDSSVYVGNGAGQPLTKIGTVPL